ncbi:MAG TPA: hypothetical protein VND62_11355 [Acidimicrobiales bacterium]|nr:hypothetical protein [Acidimicrobiales bacterium]
MQVDWYASGDPDDYNIELRWPDADSGPYTVRMVVVLAEGRPWVGRIEIDGLAQLGMGQPGSVTPITSESIRVPVAQLLHEALEVIRQDRAAHPPPPGHDYFEQLATNEDKVALSAHGKPGRRPHYGREHFEKVARVYSEALAAGYPPTAEVARKFNVSTSAAAKWVARCRRPPLGLLPPTTKGAARGGDR